MAEKIYSNGLGDEIKNIISEAVNSCMGKDITAKGVQPLDIIDRAELCRRLNITEPTAIRWEKKGRIPCFRIGSCVRYNWLTVIEVLEGKRKGGVK